MTAPVLPADSPDAIARAAAILREGGLVGMPTETVYGLAADANNAAAVARLYAAKGRPRFNPLIAHVSGIAMAKTLVAWPDLADELAAAFWPGPLTLVLPKLGGAPICDLANAGLDSVAIRSPGLRRPARRPERQPVRRRQPDHGAPCQRRPRRQARPHPRWRRLCGGCGIHRHRHSRRPRHPVAPGRPGTRPHRGQLNALSAGPGEALLGFGAIAGDLNLSATGDLAEAAARLFAALREMDAPGPSCIAVAPIPDEGLGEAINDRLQRAAAPRDGS